MTIAETKFAKYRRAQADGSHEWPDFGGGFGTGIDQAARVRFLEIERDGSAILTEYADFDLGCRETNRVLRSCDTSAVAVDMAVNAEVIGRLIERGAALGIEVADLPDLVAARVREIMAEAGRIGKPNKGVAA